MDILSIKRVESCTHDWFVVVIWIAPIFFTSDFHSFTTPGLDSLRVYDSFWFKQIGCRRGRDEAIREEEGEGEGN